MPSAIRVVDRFQDLADVLAGTPLAFGTGSHTAPQGLIDMAPPYTGGYAAIKLHTANAVRGDFNIVSQQSANLTDPRDNSVFGWGYNMTGGNVENAAEHMLGWTLETFYQPGGATRFMEHHLVYVNPSGYNTRAISMNFDRATNDSGLSLAYGRFDWRDKDSAVDPPIMSWLMASKEIQLAGALLEQQTNNVAWIRQMNAAGNGLVNLLLLDASDRITLSPQGQDVTTNSPFKLQINSALYLYNTAIDDANFERTKFGWASNGFKITTEKGGSGVLRDIELLPGSNTVRARNLYPDVSTSRTMGDGQNRWGRINVDGVETELGSAGTPPWRFRVQTNTGVFGPTQTTIGVAINGNEGLRVSEPTDGNVALLLRRNVGGTLSLQQVSMGATDSGGSGFKLLRVPN